MKLVILVLFTTISLLFAKKREEIIPIDSLSDTHLERQLFMPSVTDTFTVHMEGYIWKCTSKRNSVQNMYQGVEQGVDSLPSTLLLYSLKLQSITDSTLIVSANRQIKKQDKYFEKLSRVDSVVIEKSGLQKVKLGKTKRQRVVIPLIATAVLGSLAAIGSLR